MAKLRDIVVWAGMLLFSGCFSTNPTGFWDVVLFEMDTADGETHDQEDFGTLEFTERELLTLVARYDVLEPVAGVSADTGEPGIDAVVPISPPFVGVGGWNNDENIVTMLPLTPAVTLGEMTQTEYKAGKMAYQAEGVLVGASTVDITLHCER